MAISRVNHYVPQAYLKHFADADGKLWRYPLLVGRNSTAEWKPAHPAAMAYARDLYTLAKTGGDSDEVELWFGKTFETPADAPLTRAVTERRLDKDDWKKIINLVALQSLRTPAFFIRNMPKWDKYLDRFVEDVRSKVETDAANGKLGAASDCDLTLAKFPFEDFPMSVSLANDDTSRTTRIEVRAVNGRAMWLSVIRRHLRFNLWALQEHSWSIVTPYPGYTFFTSDDPVVLMNLRADSTFDFNAGWRTNGAFILMPLSPHHLLVTRVGAKRATRGSALTEEETILFRQAIAYHSHRQILSQYPDGSIKGIRPREISLSKLIREREEWQRWHGIQAEAERRIFKS